MRFNLDLHGSCRLCGSCVHLPRMPGLSIREQQLLVFLRQQEVGHESRMFLDLHVAVLLGQDSSCKWEGRDSLLNKLRKDKAGPQFNKAPS
jgi:hypothetical protein